MAKRVELQIVQPGQTITFDVEGEWVPRVVPVHRENSSPLEVIEVRHTWEFRSCRFVSIDGTVAKTFEKVSVLLDAINSRASQPTSARLVRDPEGANSTLLTLGSTGWEQFRVEQVDGEIDPLVADASWQTTATFTITVSAVKRNADADGIVGFSQRVRSSWVSGYQVLEWVTRITTAEGTSAVDKAKTFASLEQIGLGPTFAYETNGPDGIEYTVEDADERTSDFSSEQSSARTPTVVEAISRVREYAISVGVTAAGGSPSEFDLTVDVEVTADETTTTTRAFARGPNAQQWVLSKKPIGSLHRSFTSDLQTAGGYVGLWVKREQNEDPSSDTGSSSKLVVRVTVSGGARAQRWYPTANDQPPLIHYGGRTPYQAVVEVEVTRSGGTGLLGELQLPGELGEPWILDRNESQIGLPYVEERGEDPEQHRWKRAARLVYRAASKPQQDPAHELAGAGLVDDYVFV